MQHLGHLAGSLVRSGLRSVCTDELPFHHDYSHRLGKASKARLYQDLLLLYFTAIFCWRNCFQPTTILRIDATFIEWFLIPFAYFVCDLSPGCSFFLSRMTQVFVVCFCFNLVSLTWQADYAKSRLDNSSLKHLLITSAEPAEV